MAGHPSLSGERGIEDGAHSATTVSNAILRHREHCSRHGILANLVTQYSWLTTVDWKVSHRTTDYSGLVDMVG